MIGKWGWPLRVNNEDCLLCPRCGGEWTHIENVHISARAEDHAVTEIRVNAITATITAGPNAGAGPTGTRVGQGRRQRISLLGYCETCGSNWALVFTQHKGVTFVEAQPHLTDEQIASLTEGLQL